MQGFPKVRELFQALRGRGLQLALASSAKGEELETYKRAAKIADLIETQTAKEDAENSKPHPDIFEAALARLGHLLPDRVLVVGDTPWDIEAAKRARLARWEFCAAVSAGKVCRKPSRFIATRRTCWNAMKLRRWRDKARG